MSIAREDGVFPHLVDEAAFVDRAEFQLWGHRRERILPIVEVSRSIPIGGADRIYGRSIHGTCRATGNPFEFRYAKLKSYTQVPPFRLVMISNEVPLTGSQIDLVAGALLRRGFWVIPARVEMTFDLTQAPVRYFRKHIFTRARSITSRRDVRGRQTLYVGGPSSPWQLCVYQKTDSIVRAEFRIRRQFLRDQSIEQASDLLNLRGFNLWKLAWLRDYREDGFEAAMKATPDQLSEDSRNWPLRTVTSFVHWLTGIERDRFLGESECENLLRRMQGNLIW